MIAISVPWRKGSYADHRLQMLDCTAEIFEYGSYWSCRDWVEYGITHPNGELWARGTAETTDEAKRICEELIAGRWNANAVASGEVA